MIGHYKDGGFRDVGLPAKFKSIKFIWIEKMPGKSKFHSWIAVADKTLKLFGGIDAFYTNLQLSLESQSVLKIIPEFYKDLVGIWQLMSHGECHNIELMVSQNLWNNKLITRNNHLIVYVDLLSRGIKTVLDLYNPVGLLES